MRIFEFLENRIITREVSSVENLHVVAEATARFGEKVAVAANIGGPQGEGGGERIYMDASPSMAPTLDP